LLTNATRQMIIDTLSTLCKMMTDADNLLIFYAGHGDEKRTNVGKIKELYRNT